MQCLRIISAWTSARCLLLAGAGAGKTVDYHGFRLLWGGVAIFGRGIHNSDCAVATWRSRERHGESGQECCGREREHRHVSSSCNGSRRIGERANAGGQRCRRPTCSTCPAGRRAFRSSPWAIRAMRRNPVRRGWHDRLRLGRLHLPDGRVRRDGWPIRPVPQRRGEDGHLRPIQQLHGLDGIPTHSEHRDRQSGTSGSYSYSVTGGDPQAANCPIFDVTWGDAARFCNWLQNGQPTYPAGIRGSGRSTETGAYTLNGDTTNYHGDPQCWGHLLHSVGKRMVQGGILQGWKYERGLLGLSNTEQHRPQQRAFLQR